MHRTNFLAGLQWLVPVHKRWLNTSSPPKKTGTGIQVLCQTAEIYRPIRPGSGWKSLRTALVFYITALLSKHCHHPEKWPRQAAHRTSEWDWSCTHKTEQGDHAWRLIHPKGRWDILLNTPTLNNLRPMRFTAMAAELEKQFADPKTYGALSFEERVALIVDAEWNRRQQNKLKRLMKQATFSLSSACIEEIEYLPDRKLGRKSQTSYRIKIFIYFPNRFHLILSFYWFTIKTSSSASISLIIHFFICFQDLLQSLISIGIQSNGLLFIFYSSRHNRNVPHFH